MGVGYLHSFESSCVTTGYVGANLEIPKSTTGYMFKMAGAVVMAKSKKQPVTAVMTYDAEYYAFSMTVCYGCNMVAHVPWRVGLHVCEMLQITSCQWTYCDAW